MRWSSFVKVGLSGTSLALASLAMGCSHGEAKPDAQAEKDKAAEVTPARDLRDDARETQAREDEARERREKADQLERQRQDELARRTVEGNAPADPNAPWFLRPAGQTTPASQQPGEAQPVQSDPPKPIAAQPKPQPVQPQPNNWRIRAACGRG